MIGIWVGIKGQALENKIDAYLSPLVQAGDFYGTILIAEESEPVFIKGYGYADIEHQIPNDTHTVFHIASVNKPITAIGILLLHQRELLDIEDPVSNYISDYPNGEVITIKHLLAQTSGIPSYNRFPDYGIYAKRENTLGSVVDWFKNEPLSFEPGEKYGYSNSNYVLLAFLIEKVTGMDYEDYMTKNIFDPIGMSRTGNYTYNEIILNRASGYDPANNPFGLKKRGFYNNSMKVGSGALFSTVTDLFLLSKALQGTDLLNEETKNLMYTPIADYEYGLGWGIWPRFNKSKYDHDGASPGSVAYYSYYPDEKVTIIFLGNINSGSFQRMKKDLAAIYFGEPFEIPISRVYQYFSGEDLKQYEGRYAFESGNFFDLKVRDGALRFLWRGRGELGYLLSPTGKGQFYMRARGDEIIFTYEGGKEVIQYVELSGTSLLTRVQ